MVLAAVLMLTLQTPAENGAGVFYSYVNDRRWESVVRAADLERSPRWPAAADSPPLAPRAAVRSARAVLEKIFTRGEEWDLSRVSLQEVRGVPSSWIYLVDFVERPPSPRPGTIGSFIGEQMTVVVLMNGTAITPTSRPAKK